VYEDFHKFANHVRNCKLNPKREIYIRNMKKSLNKRKSYQITCRKCGKLFKLQLTDYQYENGKHRKYCSYKCSNSRIHTKESREKISKTLTGRKYPDRKIEREERACPVCGQRFIVPKSSTLQTCGKDACIRMLLSRTMKKLKVGGHTSKRAIYYKCRDGSKIYLQSDFEVRVAKSLDANNIKWVRPKPIPWHDKIGELHWYYPDFCLVNFKIYLDPKNDYLIKMDAEKISRVAEQNNVKVLVLNEKQLQWDIIKGLIMSSA